MSEQLRDELTNVLVMTKLSDFAGTDMKIIDAAINALLPVVERRLESVKQEAYSDGLSEGYRLEQELDAAKADAEQRALANKDAQDGIDDYLKWAGLR